MKEWDVLLVVDMQNDFIDGALGTKEAPKIIDNVVATIDVFKDYGDIIVYTKDLHDDHYSETREGMFIHTKHCMKNTHGADICDKVHNALEDDECKAHDIIKLEKSTFGATIDPLYLRLRRYNNFDWCRTLEVNKHRNKIKKIFIVGLCTDICILSNAIILQNLFPDAEIIVDASSCAGTTPEAHDRALECMMGLGITVAGMGEEPWREK